MEKLADNQSIIISLDVDAHLFEKLEKIAATDFALVEINSADQSLLTRALERFPTLRIGAGNIISLEQLEDCYKAKVHFATSPGLLPALAQTASVYSMNYLPGVATLSEAMLALSLGYEHVRPFPATLSFCSLLNKYLPRLRLFPAEIEWDEVEHFFNLPAVAAVSILNPEYKQVQALRIVAST